jgi:hypothetical protein
MTENVNRHPDSIASSERSDGRDNAVNAGVRQEYARSNHFMKNLPVKANGVASMTTQRTEALLEDQIRSTLKRSEGGGAAIPAKRTPCSLLALDR